MSEHPLLTLRLETADGTADYPIGPAELLHFERRFPGVTVDDALRSSSFEHLLWLGWRSATRRKVTELDFDAWADTLEGIDMGDLRAQAADLIARARVPLPNGALPVG